MKLTTLIINMSFMIALLSSCAGFLGVADDIERIANNDAITIKVDKDAFIQNCNVKITVDVENPKG